MNEYIDSLLRRLPGTAEEQDWVRKHLETLNVREGIILTAAGHDHAIRKEANLYGRPDPMFRHP